jgi:hypothetical protein
LPVRQPHSFDCRQPDRQTDGESGEDDVEADDEGKLDTRQKKRDQIPSSGTSWKDN